jgi:hypothetical protein
MTEDTPNIGRCPLDGAPLREWTMPINSDPTYVHTDGHAHGGLLELAEKWDAALPLLGARVAALRPQMEAQSRAGLAMARALECSSAQMED